MEPWRAKAVKLFAGQLALASVPPGAPRLISVATGGHCGTLRAVAHDLARRGIRHERWSYRKLFARWRLPQAVYVLTDFDRLHPWQIELAARLRARLVDEGLSVLNDPRRFLPRHALLRQLYRAGINSFTCWLPAEGEWPARYPVFLRTIHAHRGVESGLLQTEAEAAAALDAALARGRVLCDLVFVEYAAEPDPDSGKMRKHACYGVAGTMIRALSVTEEGWMAKFGTVGAARAQDYAADLAEQGDYPHADLMRRVFDLAGADFGRIDFGLVRGRAEIYELNTNPYIAWNRAHPNPDRMAVDRLIRSQLLDALSALPYPARGRGVGVRDLIARFTPDRHAPGQP